MLVQSLRRFSGQAADLLEKPLEEYIELETSDAVDNEVPRTFASRERALVTVIRVLGARDIKGDEDLKADVARCVEDTKPVMGDVGHGVEFAYSSDSDQGRAAAVYQLVGARAAAASIGLDLEPFFAAQEEYLGERAREETLHLALWTWPLLLSSVERKEALENARQAAAGWPGRGARYAQNPYLPLAVLRNRHDGFVNAFKSAMGAIGVEIEELDCYEAGRDMYESLWQGERATGFELCLPGDPVPVMVPDGDDPSAVLWPKIGRQLSVWNATRENWEVARFGGRIFSAVDVVVGPQKPKDFGRLRDRLARARVPFRMSMRLRSGGEKQMSWGAWLAPFAALFGADNRRIMKSLERVRKRAEIDGCVTWQVSFATWADAGQQTLLQSRLAELRRCVQQWGTQQVRSMCGDPVQGVLSSAMGISLNSTAETGYAPLAEVYTMMPRKAASPWRRGAVPFLTADGAFFPYEEGSAEVDYAFTLILAVMRSGKSALLSRLVRGNILSSGSDKLPYVSLLDVGFSSGGEFETLRESLPPSRRHEIEHVKLRNDKQFAINILNPLLGCRMVTSDHLSMIVEAFCVLATPAEARGEAPEGLSSLMTRLITEAFRLKSDTDPDAKPNRYTADTDAVVDAALARCGIQTTTGEGTPALWWRLVDRLFEAGDVVAAARAQRYAVPTAQDVLNALQVDSVRQDFRTYMVGHQKQSLLEVVENELKNALAEFHIGNGVTRFDPSARMLAFDLQDVLGKGTSDGAKKQTALVYTWCMVALTQRWWIRPADVSANPLIPVQYRAWHFAQAEDIASTPKVFVADEFHETAGAPSARSAIVKMVRNGPKYTIRTILSSQMLEDFDEDMRKLASALFVLSYTEALLDQLATLFNLRSAHRDAIRKLGRKDKRLGVPIFAVLNTKRGQFANLIYSAMSPRELWAVATNPREVTLRWRLTNKVGFVRAVELLANYEPFRHRPAEEEINTRVQRYLEQGENDAAEVNRVIDEMVDEMVAQDREMALRRMEQRAR